MKLAPKPSVSLHMSQLNQMGTNVQFDRTGNAMDAQYMQKNPRAIAGNLMGILGQNDPTQQPGYQQWQFAGNMMGQGYGGQGQQQQQQQQQPGGGNYPMAPN